MSKNGVVNIRGKQYQTVPLRVSQFRQLRPEWTIATHIIENTENRVVMKAEIADDKGRLIATGYAEEFRAASQINKTSALENSETSAVGRALAFLGLAGDESIASAEEVLAAITLQESGGPDLGKHSAPVAAPNKYDHDDLREFLEKTPAEFESWYVELPDSEKTEVFNAAPKGEKTAWKDALRYVENQFHNRMNEYEAEISETINNCQNDALNELLEEVEAWEKPYIWSRLSDQERQYIKNLRESEYE